MRRIASHGVRRLGIRTAALIPESELWLKTLPYYDKEMSKISLNQTLDSWWFKILSLFNKHTPESVYAAQNVYNDIAHHVTKPMFYDDLQLPYTYGISHSLAVLHIWIIKQRMVIEQEGERPKEFEQQLFEQLWEHQRHAIVNSGVPNVKIVNKKKRMHTLSVHEMADYGAAWEQDILNKRVEQISDNDMFKVIFGIIFRETKGTERSATRLNAYVLQEISRVVEETSRQDIYVNGVIHWGKVPKLE